MTLSRKVRIVGGLLLGAAAATAALALAYQNSLPPQSPDGGEKPVEKEKRGGDVEVRSDGIVTVNNARFQVAGLTHPGKRRPNNQDAFKIADLQQDYVLAVVCDGMGGHAGGEVASGIATDLIWTVVSKLRGTEPQSIYEAMEEALRRADAAIEQRASKEPELRGMGTTAVLAAIGRDEYIHCHLGDSRLYHFRGGEAIYQTKDHSVVRFLVEEGIITSDEAKDHPYRSQLTSSLGGGPKANRLTIEPKWDAGGTPHRRWESGDWLLLCSDGLNSELEDEEIAAVLANSGTPSEAIRALQQKVLETEARDNVTLIVARKA